MASVFFVCVVWSMIQALVKTQIPSRPRYLCVNYSENTDLEGIYRKDTDSYSIPSWYGPLTADISIPLNKSSWQFVSWNTSALTVCHL